VQGVFEARRIRRVVGEALRDRAPLTDEAFGFRFFDPAIAPTAARLRRLLADNLECDLAGLMPADDFERWLGLSSGPDSAGDMFFEELAIEYRLTHDLPWPARFGSFDALVQFVARYGQLPGIRPRDQSDSGMTRSWVNPRKPDPPGNESGTGPYSGVPRPSSPTPNNLRSVAE
jgi:hypothetical protein